MDFFQAVGNQLERFPEAFFQGRLELLVDRATHLLEPQPIVLTEFLELGLHGLADILQLGLIGGREFADGVGEVLEALSLVLAQHVQPIEECLIALLEDIEGFRASLTGVRGRLLSEVGELVAENGTLFLMGDINLLKPGADGSHIASTPTSLAELDHQDRNEEQQDKD